MVFKEMFQFEFYVLLNKIESTRFKENVKTCF